MRTKPIFCCNIPTKFLPMRISHRSSAIFTPYNYFIHSPAIGSVSVCGATTGRDPSFQNSAGASMALNRYMSEARPLKMCKASRDILHTFLQALYTLILASGFLSYRCRWSCLFCRDVPEMFYEGCIADLMPQNHDQCTQTSFTRRYSYLLLDIKLWDIVSLACRCVVHVSLLVQTDISFTIPQPSGQELKSLIYLSRGFPFILSLTQDLPYKIDELQFD